MSVESVKDKLWRKCGTYINSMPFELYDDTTTKVAALTDNSTPLGFYSPLHGHYSPFQNVSGLDIPRIFERLYYVWCFTT
ncbi:hypothetical protein CUMW_159150 [Citrus unshiu]|uniref:Ubiquitin-like domain-containing protein n=1 Tax=Citrus unshiu TaxID=55188 RepID=A0A2H5PRM6_CITUN|nr:hypothetical protein CUMW_159150 [Citrus unshiu]